MVRLLHHASLMALLLAAEAAEDLGTAVEASDACDDGEDGECALSFRQLRGNLLMAEDKLEPIVVTSAELGAASAAVQQDRHPQPADAHAARYAPGPWPTGPMVQVSNLTATANLSPLRSSLPFGHPSSTNYPQHPGFTLYLVEDFNEPIDLDHDPIWTWSDGGLKEGQTRFIKEQVTFGGGLMRITLDHNHGQGNQQACSHAQADFIKPYGQTKPLVGGELRTRNNWFRYGRYEMRMKAPSVQPGRPDIDGNYVATMFVYRDAGFEHWREVDVEVTSMRQPGYISMNLLNAEHTKDWRKDMEDPLMHSFGINPRSDFHTYAFEWLPHEIKWFIDDKLVRSYHAGGKVPIPDKSAKIMFNLWVYAADHPRIGLFGGQDIENNQFPMHAEYDWFRYYKWDGDSEYPPKEPKMEYLRDDDLYLTGNNPCDGIPQLGKRYGEEVCLAKC